MACAGNPEGEGLFASTKLSLTTALLEESHRSASAQHLPVPIQNPALVNMARCLLHGPSTLLLGAHLHRHPSALGAPQPFQK